jgi:hypothetical protein
MLSAPLWLKLFNPPICQGCQTAMAFVRSVPEERWAKLRTFKCLTCRRTAKDLVQYGPMFKTVA